MTLRVLHFASGDGWGGAERVIETLVDSLRAQARIEALLLNEGRLAVTLRQLGVPVAVCPEQDRSFAHLLADVRRQLARTRPDVVHCHRYKELLLATLATLGSKTPLVVTVHGLEPRSQLTARQFLTIWGCILLARLCGAHFAAVSPELRARLARWPLSVAALEIPNPMPEVARPARASDLRGRFGWGRDTRVVGFLGRLETVKGPDLLLDVVARTPATLRFAIAGDGSLAAALRARVEAEGRGDRVAFLGMIADGAALLHEIDVLAIPSRHEGTPMALLEAAACAVPVVAFGVGGLPALLEAAPRAWCVPPGDVEAFAAALVSIAEDPRGAREAATSFSAAIRPRYARSAVAAAYLGLYERAVRAASKRLQGASPADAVSEPEAPRA